ncbi:MAG: hypothetical protein U1E39_19125 [Planctomycetota bacterium]
MRRHPWVLALLLALSTSPLRAARADDPVGVPMDDAFCSQHGYYSGPTCPGCASAVGSDEPPAPTGPAAPGNVPPAASPTALEEANRKLTALLEELRPLRRPQVRALSEAAAADSMAAVFARLERLGFGLEYDREYVETRRQELLGGARDPATYAARLRDDVARLTTEAAESRDRLAAAQADLAQARASLAREERAWKPVRAAEEAAAARLAKHSERTLRTLIPLLPPEEREALERVASAPRAPGAFAPQPRRGPSDFVPVIAERPNPIRAGRPGLPARLEGDVDQRIATCRERRDRLLAASRAYEEARQAVADQRDVAERRDALSKEVALTVAAAGDAAREARRASSELFRELENGPVSASNALQLAAATLVWDHVQARVVMPAVEAFLDANGLLEGKNAVDVMLRLKDHPEDLVPKVGALRELPRIVETARRVVEVEADFEVWATLAADALARGDTKPDPGLVEDLFRGVDRKGVAVMKAAADADDGVVGKLTELLMDRAPKD